MSGKRSTIIYPAVLVFYLSILTGRLASLGRIGLQDIEQELLFCSNHNLLCECTCVHNLFMHGIFKFTDAI